jgi:hypothetical protein
LVTSEARFAVMVVPIFSPSTMEIANGKFTIPLAAKTSVNANAALDDWNNAASAVPIRKNKAIDKTPLLFIPETNPINQISEEKSGIIFRRNSSPKNISDRPMTNSPQYFCELRMRKRSKNPIPKRGNARLVILMFNPMVTKTHAFRVVPIFAPIIIPAASVSERSPAFTKLTIITLTAEDDCMMPVMANPETIALNRLDATEARIDRMRKPDAFCRESLISFIPYKNKPTAPINDNMPAIAIPMPDLKSEFV